MVWFKKKDKDNSDASSPLTEEMVLHASKRWAELYRQHVASALIPGIGSKYGSGLSGLVTGTTLFGSGTTAPSVLTGLYPNVTNEQEFFKKHEINDGDMFIVSGCVWVRYGDKIQSLEQSTYGLGTGVVHEVKIIGNLFKVAEHIKTIKDDL